MPQPHRVPGWRAAFAYAGTAFVGPVLALAGAVHAAAPPLPMPTFTAAEAGAPKAHESWRYARAGAFEILSQLPDAETQRQVRELLFVHKFIASICPEPEWEPRYTQLCLTIFHPKEKKAAYLDYLGANDTVLSERVQRPTAFSSRKFLRGREQTALVHLGDFYRNPYSSGAAVIHNIFQQFAPRPPVWFRVGVGNLVRLMDPDVTWDLYAMPMTPDFRVTLLPMQQMFDQMLPPPDALTIEPTEAGRETPLAAWHNQIALFIHFGIWGDGGRHRNGFVRFVHRTCSEPATEALFRECLAMDYGQMLVRLRAYAASRAFADVDLPTLRKRLLSDLPRVSFRPATAADAARITAEARIMSGHIDAAHGDLVDAYRRGGAGARDPQLLGALGLREIAARRPDRARPLLEAAVVTGVPRPMVYYELARLRLADVSPTLTTAAPLTREQAEPVLALLREARERKPPLVDVYRLKFEVLAQVQGPLMPDDLQALEEASQHFPRDAELRRRGTELQQRRREVVDSTDT